MVSKSVQSSRVIVNHTPPLGDKVLFGFQESWPVEIYKDYRGFCRRKTWIRLL